MKRRVIHLQEKDCLSVQEADALMGKLLDEIHYNVLLQGEDAEVYKPDGSPLLIYLNNVLSNKSCKEAYPNLRGAAKQSFNRGLAAGEVSEEDLKKRGERWSVREDGKRMTLTRKDGTVSNTGYAKPVESGVIGYYDRYPRIPYCRLTAFNLDNPEKFEAALPFIQEVDRVFARELPARHKAQMDFIKRTTPEFTISGTSFTTVTVNRNWRTAAHKDVGDLLQGFGVMSAFTTKAFKGCYLIFPRYKVAVEMRTRSVLLADVHEVHGSSPILSDTNLSERVSVVLYYRERMVDCGTPEQERARAEKGMERVAKKRLAEKKLKGLEGLP